MLFPRIEEFRQMPPFTGPWVLVTEPDLLTVKPQAADHKQSTPEHAKIPGLYSKDFGQDVFPLRYVGVCAYILYNSDPSVINPFPLIIGIILVILVLRPSRGRVY